MKMKNFSFIHKEYEKEKKFFIFFSIMDCHKILNTVPFASLVGQMVKNLPATLGYPGSIPGLGRSPGEGNSYPL